MDAFFLVFGLTGLWLGSQLAVRGAQNISQHFRISPLFVGLVILAIGTDLPELSVTIAGTLKETAGADASGVVLGNAIGSILSQGTLIVGITAFFGTLAVARRMVLRDGLMMLASLVFFLISALDGTISTAEGVLLLSIYAIYLLLILQTERNRAELPRKKTNGIFWTFIYLAGGLGLLVFSSSLVVDSTLRMASAIGISQVFISILAIGLGTSLPELATSVAAVRRGEGSLAFGNLVGSCTLDALLLPGIGALIASGLPVDSALLTYDLPAALIALTLVVIMFLMTKRFDRRYALAAIILYFLFFVGRAFIL
ncbi:sodium:calcium antiporter [Candidatus Uhrbacteria bacterium]|nr:sodium:calcium antiporter [Candidatus Uhrbacteria bacterium]